MKNKKGEKVTWKLFRLKISPGQEIYFWVDPKNIIRHERGTSCWGWSKPSDDYFGIMGYNIWEVAEFLPEIKQINHKMNDTELEKGWLLL